ncbi:P-loop containing nucleoside triphosphate hydrolase protein [Dichotomocladium elegans]|nr:P-loop containing nucleoside triphosphate hydrolase protein [Dichotomocladium elegans]
MTVDINARQAVEVYTRGTKAWFEDKVEAWVSATCISNTISGDRVAMVFEGDSDAREYIFESTLQEIEKSGGSKLPPLRNPPKMEYTDDLTNLSHLNEPAVLNTIRTRYLQHLIYTYSGIVLIAVNPFDRVSLYEPDIIQQYSGKRRGELEPHLFAIAEDAYRCMIREQTNQTIVVSGESGAGKTVSAKYIMRYFATADDQESEGKRKKTSGGMTEVEEQILATNPIMEAFGNAKTTRNDNSSRFGKYIEIQFDDGANIIGAKIRTYLLERSRLIFQPQTERNYHIFYQLCAGAPLSEKKEYELDDYTAFHYLNQSGTGTIPNVDDAAEFEITQRALSTVGLSVQLQWKIFRLLAALLHIGNIQIGGRGDAVLSESDRSLQTASKLMGINPAEFRKWIVRKQIVTRSEKIVTNLTPAQAQVVKDSVAKYVYANLFEWLVGVINDSLSCPDRDQIATFIGVLDIYGFEHFKKNSFEQFCINYANEKLQQQFNQHVFKLEQEEYIREEINWSFIEFSDNQKCIELIEARMGILSLLDEESRLPAGTDQAFCQKLYDNFDTPEYRPYFKKPRFSNKSFTISHYAHDVEYTAENFLDKNKDTVPDEHLNLLQSSEFDFLTDVLDKAAAANPPPPVENKRMSMMFRKPTLGSIFKLSLINLMDTIGQTNVHYIRCIKPNEAKVAWTFEANMVLAQLRACGVLETIRISCAGYPSRWSFEEFADRYYALVPSKHWDNRETLDIPKLCSTILDFSIKDRDQYQVGLTKIFFRAGQLAYMEKMRSDRFNACATVLQKNIRRHIYHTRYIRVRALAIRLQRVARRKIAESKLQAFREEKAAVVIQAAWRRYVVRKQYLATHAFVVQLQTAIRSCHARRNLVAAREELAAVQIQRLVRGWFARKEYRTRREFIIRLQACVRRRASQKELAALRKEARSANHFKEVSYKLENTIVELTQTLTSLKEEKKVAEDRTVQLEAQVRTWIEKYERLEKKAKGLESKLAEPTVPEEKYLVLQSERDAISAEHRSTQEKVRQYEREVGELNQQLKGERQEIVKLHKSLEKAQERVENAVDEGELAELKSQNAALKAQLAQLMNTPRHQQRAGQQQQGLARGLSPAPLGGIRNLSPSPNRPTVTLDAKELTRPRSKSPANHRGRRNSTTDMPVHRPKLSIDTIRQAEQVARNPRPTSFHHFRSLLGGRNRVSDIAESVAMDPEEEMNRIFRDEDGLIDELVGGLIKGLKMPLPSLQNRASKKEIFFPAHMISLCVTKMWQLGNLAGSERLLFTVMDSIQKQCLSYTGDTAIVPCGFWLSNVHELLSLLCVAEHQLEQEMHEKGSDLPLNWQDFEKLAATIKFELQCLEDNIYHAWLKETKKRLSKMIIPAIIESQLLPGVMSTDSTRFFNKLVKSAAHPSFSMDDLLNTLNTMRRVLTCYYIEHSVASQVLSELLKLIGVTAFNDLLMRKNFSTWKRAMQIQYNITRLEEWCKSHDIPEGTLQLEHLNQATKLLQLKKTSQEDVENLYDVCWILSPSQIQKLIYQYQSADYENPIQPDILKVVASRVVSGNASDILLLDTVAIDDTTNPFEIPPPRETELQCYLPSSVSNLARPWHNHT